jgi:hypothetical protein
MKLSIFGSVALVLGAALLLASQRPAAALGSPTSAGAAVDPACIAWCLADADAFFTACVGGDPQNLASCAAARDVRLRGCLRTRCGVVTGSFELGDGLERIYRIEAGSERALALDVHAGEALVSVNGVPSFVLGSGLHVLPQALQPGCNEVRVVPLATEAGVEPRMDVLVR